MADQVTRAPRTTVTPEGIRALASQINRVDVQDRAVTVEENAEVEAAYLALAETSILLRRLADVLERIDTPIHMHPYDARFDGGMTAERNAIRALITSERAE